MGVVEPRVSPVTAAVAVAVAAAAAAAVAVDGGLTGRQAVLQRLEVVAVAATAPIDELGAGVVDGVEEEPLDEGPAVAGEGRLRTALSRRRCTWNTSMENDARGLTRVFLSAFLSFFSFCRGVVVCLCWWWW